MDSDWKVETIDALREAYTEAKVIISYSSNAPIQHMIATHQTLPKTVTSLIK
jgi:hypothetical protein